MLKLYEEVIVYVDIMCLVTRADLVLVNGLDFEMRTQYDFHVQLVDSGFVSIICTM